MPKPMSLHRLPAAAGGHERRQLSGEVRLAGGSLVALDRRLEQRELGDHQPFGCCVQGQRQPDDMPYTNADPPAWAMSAARPSTSR
jgi:hypothetical protein